MRKLYYISKTNQKLKEFEYLSLKSILIYVVFLFFLLGLSWGVINLIDHFTASTKNILSLETENSILRNKLKNLTEQYKSLDGDLEELQTENNYLRLATNLPPTSKEEKIFGTGGSDFDKSIKFSNSSLKDVDELSGYIETLHKKLSLAKDEYQLISRQLNENKILYASIPAIKPCEGLIGQNGFGMREHPILGINKMHEGIDIITDVGTNVRSAGNGIVSFVGMRGGYGLAVEIEHASGYKTIYAHLSGSLVKEGQTVTRGKVIALTGNSGLSTGPHLHYEVHHDGIKLDPAQFFFDDLLLFEQKSTK